MRKTLTLLALSAILALSAAVFGSPPTKAKTQKKTLTVKTDAIVTADTSAVAPRGAEARTVEIRVASDACLQNVPVAGVAKADFALTNRHNASPHIRLHSGIAEERTNMKTIYERAGMSAPSGYVMRR